MPSARSTAWVVASLRNDARPVWLRHRGWSMAPALRHGDHVLVEPVQAGSLLLGEIAVVLRAGRLVAHRLVSRSSGYVVTRGDACALADPPVWTHHLLGRVVRRQSRWAWLFTRLFRNRRLVP